jgi:hypothetical protein
MNNFYVYGHFKPNEDIPFYVGKGTGRRAWQKNGRNEYWKNVVNKYGYEVKLLEENLTEEGAYERERELIIEIGLDKLTNILTGGEGMSSEDAKRLAKKRVKNPDWRKNMEGVWKNRSEEHKNNIKTAMQKLYSDPNFTKKIKTALKHKHKDPEYRKKMEELTQTPKWCENHKQGILNREMDPEWRNKRKKMYESSEWRKNVKNANRKTAQDPEWRSKQKEGAKKMAQNPEWRKKMEKVWAANRKKKEKTN